MSNDILNAVQEYMINGHVSDAPFIINDYVITLERLDNGVRISATRGGQTESVVVYDGDLTNLNHEVLANRGASDQHPINAISGLRSELDSKQPVISDLEQIRTNAGKGATAVQHNELSNVAMTGSYNDLNGKPNLARVATSGSYNDLVDKPSMVLDHNNLTGRSGYNQHPMSSITGLIDNLNSKQGVISDLSEIRSSARKADTAVQPSDLARVATTGSYNDLTDKPTVFGNEVEVGPTPEDADLWIDTSESGSNVDPSVRWDVEQSLDHTSRARARGNIGATLRELLNEDYTADRVMFPSSSVTVQTQFGMKFAQFIITGAAGNRIVMILNGTKYECYRGTYSDSDSTPFRYYYGNASIYNFMFDNTEEPFVLFTTGIENAAAMLIFRSDYAESTATVSITTYDAYANSIPYANMPGGYPTISIGETYAMIDGDYYVSEDYGYNNTPFNKDYAYTVNFENSIRRYEPTDIQSFTEGDYSGYYIGNGSLNTWADVPGPDTGEGYCLAFYEGEEDYVYFFFADDEPHRIGCFVHHPDVIDKIDDRFVKVNDVQVNGASIVENGVANVPIAGQQKLGVVRYADSSVGLVINSQGYITLASASDSQIATRNNNPRPITIMNLDYAVKSAMTDGRGAAWTASEQAAARERMGFDKFELIADVSITESVSAIDVPVDFTKYKEIAISFFMFTDSAKTIRFGVKDKYNATYLLTYDTPSANVGFFCDTSIEPGEDAYADVSSNKKFIARSTSCSAASWTNRLSSYNRGTIYSGYRPVTSRRYDELTHVHATVNSGQTIPIGASITVYGRR